MSACGVVVEFMLAMCVYGCFKILISFWIFFFNKRTVSDYWQAMGFCKQTYTHTLIYWEQSNEVVCPNGQLRGNEILKKLTLMKPSDSKSYIFKEYF